MTESKEALDSLIVKSRVHLYKPIQIAEILYRSRKGIGNVDLHNLDTYRRQSKRWRDDVTQSIINSTCTSSAKFQDNLFDANAIPPKTLSELDVINTKSAGAVEAYIYKKLESKHFQLAAALKYCIDTPVEKLDIRHFVSQFSVESGLKRSIDKVFEIVVFALLETLTTTLEITVDIYSSVKEKGILEEFTAFAEAVLQLDQNNGFKNTALAHFHRAGVTNAADRGLDMYSNFGPIVQVKHISLALGVAEDITNTVTATNIVIVCLEAQAETIKTVLSQVGWGNRIQSVVTFEQLYTWYELALHGKYANLLARPLKQLLEEEIRNEFPVIGQDSFGDFMTERGYNKIDLAQFQ